MTDHALLICYDGSDAAKEAIERAAALHPGASVEVLSVWQPMRAFVMSWGLMAGDVGHMDVEARKYAKQLSAEGARLARAAGLEPSEAIVEAPMSVGRTILEWAAAHDSKLIVIGATGRSAVTDVVTGSVANVIVHHADVPVLLARLPHHHRAHEAATETTERVTTSGAA